MTLRRQIELAADWRIHRQDLEEFTGDTNAVQGEPTFLGPIIVGPPRPSMNKLFI